MDSSNRRSNGLYEGRFAVLEGDNAMNPKYPEVMEALRKCNSHTIYRDQKD